MNQNHQVNELLVRYLDGSMDQREASEVQRILKEDERARSFFIEVAEQAVMMADLERTVSVRQAIVTSSSGDSESGLSSKETSFKNSLWRLRTWQLAAAVCLVAMLSVSAFAYVAVSKPSIARVVKVTGASQYFGASGRSEDALRNGVSLVAGDMVESRSCDAWITLDAEQDATLTIAGNSALRVQFSKSNEKRFELIRGSLWYSPSKQSEGQRVVIQTPTLHVEFQEALLNVQTSASESIVRVHSGTARVTRRLDGQVVDTVAGKQTFVSLGDKQVLQATPQPTPVLEWSSRQMKGPEVLLGNWLPPTEFERTRLGAAPLLWPVPDREPVMLYAAAIAAWRCSDHPVMLDKNSKLRFRGRTQHAHTVRFGFSAQKMYGVFAGKFEIDVLASSLGQPEEYWSVELPLADFRPLHPQLASSPEQLELTDVYALTVVDDAGLEITDVELIPAAK